MLNKEERSSLDSLQIGRKFSLPSFAYETKYSFANIFAKQSLSVQKDTIEDVDLAIRYLKNEGNIPVGDKLKYEKLQNFWTETGNLALEIKALNADQKDDDMRTFAPPEPTPVDPFDQMFADL